MQKKFKDLEYDLTLEEVYDVWYRYSEKCYANWLNVNGDITDSTKEIDYVLNREKFLEKSLKIIKERPCGVERTCLNSMFSNIESEYCLKCKEYCEYSPIDQGVED